MAVLLQINIIPIGKEGASFSDALAEVLKVVEERNRTWTYEHRTRGRAGQSSGGCPRDA